MKAGLTLALLAVAMLASGCSRSNARRVIVVYPERWFAGEFRNCALVGSDPISKLPQLDCDLQASDTPRSRMFVMDVGFSGNALGIQWTCQKTKESLICRN